jgi:MoaA/NifB/PqqE/SkfB family radical SAM enzyme
MAPVSENSKKQDKIYEFFVQWHLTERCNLKCAHCYQSGIHTDEMSFEEIRKVTVEVSDMLSDWEKDHGVSFAPSMNISGGEPFLRNDLFQIIKMIKGYGFEVYILSNGTILDYKKAAMLFDIGVSGVQVSMEGPELIHDRIRGPGNFERALNGIKILLAHKIEVTLNVTLSSLNYRHVKETISLASELGVQRLGFSRLVPSGRGMQFLDEILSPVQARETYEEILNDPVEGLEIVTGDPVASQRNLKHPGSLGCTAFGGCAAGVSGLTFQPDGTINPCRRLNIPIGNIKRDSIREVWAASEVLASLRDRDQYKGKCGQCDRWANCRGCRAIAYACSCAKGENDFLAEDPQCFIES